ncbi:calmodulin, putative [Pediculus humanus corporis]|uniref:Calmodulin, putative n=1 Tax=Pediculus humanus subsp. corporis TaxID=121224 RepID=E0VFP3_PEDHC|nr:calmodulin, putative [Pediculus humanus corporis]EEB12199.1 calmodulin, putative [Pediculus humanus corporis]
MDPTSSNLGHSTTADLGSELEKRITEAFEIFDHGGNQTVDVREIGTILRSMGCCPTEEELQEILVTVEDHETSSVRLTTFLPVVTKIITERKLQPASPEELLKAFHTIDKDRKGYITKEYLTELITKEIQIQEGFTMNTT